MTRKTSGGPSQGEDMKAAEKIEGADVEAALEGIRKRTATNMGAPQVRLLPP